MPSSLILWSTQIVLSKITFHDFSNRPINVLANIYPWNGKFLNVFGGFERLAWPLQSAKYILISRAWGKLEEFQILNQFRCSALNCFLKHKSAVTFWMQFMIFWIMDCSFVCASLNALFLSFDFLLI